MSDPRYRVERRLEAPPDAVLAAIRQALTATRTADIPPHLRRTTITGIAGGVRGPRFRVGFTQWAEGDVTEVVGHVVPADDGGSLVQASVADDRNAPAFIAVTLGIVLLVALAGGQAAAWIAGVAAVVGIMAWVRRAMGGVNHDEARFLVAWLEGVLDRFPPSPPMRERGMQDQPDAPPTA